MRSLIGSFATICLAFALTMLPAADRLGPAHAKNAVQARNKVTLARKGFADVDGVRIAYEIYGDLSSGKTPLLMLHGSFMSATAMAPLIGSFVSSRPVVAVDARGHGRTGDVPGPITYERMADDAAAVLRALGVKRVDVFGYSMGATTALVMAVRHPNLVDKQVIMSGVSERSGWFPAAQESFEKWNAEMFAGSPVEASWKNQSATPNAFASVIVKLRAAETANYDLSPQQLRDIPGKTMFVAGDYDGVQLNHALHLFTLRGGNSEAVAMQGFLSGSPRARFAILPATTHVGIYGEGSLLAQLVVPFLDDRSPKPLIGFFKGMDKPAKTAQ
jgi:pimeloyl-ACP methyl ester carboxylesterase